MSKVVWITVMNKEANEENAKKLYQTVAKYGLNPGGHFWDDNLPQMSWTGAREDLVKKDTSLWIILGSPEDFAVESVRYGLSMLAADVLFQHGAGFPVMIVLTGGQLESDSLPTLFQGADSLELTNPSLGAKIVAKANMPVKKVETDYKLDVYGVQGIGQWFEIGPPAGHSWKGVMFGVSDGEINAHGVGPSGKLPERSVVEYPMKGLKLSLGEVEYTAWAVQNELGENDSYYLRVNDFPTSIIFGPMSEGDDAEVFVLKLK